MAQGGAKKSRLIILSVFIVFFWFFLFGIRLIGYFTVIKEKGLREAVCGTQGCSNIALAFDLFSTFSFLIVIPLIIPLILIFYWSSKEQNS
jgi:hypothetical protein